MTVLGDFVHVMRPTNQVLFVPPPMWPLAKFNTGGRRNDDDAFLIIVARNLQGSGQIFINDDAAGIIRSTGPAGAYSTQTVGIPRGGLKDGDNTFEFRQVTDQFELYSVTCFFHQDS